jgi:hypothetical protein
VQQAFFLLLQRVESAADYLTEYRFFIEAINSQSFMYFPTAKIMKGTYSFVSMKPLHEFVLTSSP